MSKKWGLFSSLLWLICGVIFFLHAFNFLHFLNFERVRDFFGVSFEVLISQFLFLHLLLHTMGSLIAIGLGFVIFVIIIPSWLYVFGDKLKEKFGENFLLAKFFALPFLVVIRSKSLEGIFNLIKDLTDFVLPKLQTIFQSIFSGFVKFFLAGALSLVGGIFSDAFWGTQFILYYSIPSEMVFFVAGFLCFVWSLLPGQFLFIFTAKGGIKYRTRFGIR